MVTVHKQLLFIRASLGLTLKQMSTVLGVDYQTFYRFLNQKSQNNLNTKTSNRVLYLYQFALQWNNQCKLPVGKLANDIIIDNLTLLDFLSKEYLNSETIQKVIIKLAEMVKINQQYNQTKLQTSVIPPETCDDRILENATSIKLF